jgi:flavodoxin
MKALVIYDSQYGNTKALAEAIGHAVGAGTVVLAAASTEPSQLQGLDLLIAGSPTQGGRPTAAVTGLVSKVEPGGLNGTAVAAFDTRIAAQDKNFAVRLLMKVIGYAAPRIARALQDKGGRLAAAPEGFMVRGTEGPLAAGEAERAAAWAAAIAATTQVKEVKP